MTPRSKEVTRFLSQAMYAPALTERTAILTADLPIKSENEL
jgi:hypothetical protein